MPNRNDRNADNPDVLAVRTICPFTWDGEHVWIQYSSLGIQQCHECEYTEEIERDGS